MQETIPSSIEPLSEVEDAVRTALPWLEQAYCLMNSNRLEGEYHELYTAICDAMTATQEAVDRLEDAPDQDVNGELEDILSLIE